MKSAAYEELLEALPETGSGAPGAPPGRSEHPDVHAQWYFDQRRLWLTSKFWSPALFEWWMRRFREGLPRVRRALANVPTYMIADDHEITDDWYFSRQWREAVFTRPLGVDIIRHGLMAYTLMQGWGNDPRRWAGGVERELLEQMRTWIAATPAVRRTSAEPVARTARPAVHGAAEHGAHVPSAGAVLLSGRRSVPSRAGGRRPHAPAIPLPQFAGGGHRLRRPHRTVRRFGDGRGASRAAGQRHEDHLRRHRRAGARPRRHGAGAAAVPAARAPAAERRCRSLVLRTGDRSKHCCGRCRATDPSCCSRATSTSRFPRRSTTGARRPARKCAPRASSSSSRAASRRTGAARRRCSRRTRSPTTSSKPRPTASVPTERVGWGTPVRTALTPPVALGKMVTVPKGKVAHPSYRSRLKMRAPVVPTHGWPAGSTEERPPEWGWRLAMERDQRPESTSTPTLERRWTPVESADRSGRAGLAGLAREGGAAPGVRPRVRVRTQHRHRHPGAQRRSVVGAPRDRRRTAAAGGNGHDAGRPAAVRHPSHRADAAAARHLEHEPAARARRRRVGRGRRPSLRCNCCCTGCR